MTQELYTQPNCPSSLNEKKDVISNAKTQNKDSFIKIEEKKKEYASMPKFSQTKDG